MSLDSTGSTGHFDVNEGRVHQKSQSSYDEMDEEVAEVMGEDVRDSYASEAAEGDVRDSYSEDMLGMTYNSFWKFLKKFRTISTLYNFPL